MSGADSLPHADASRQGVRPRQQLILGLPQGVLSGPTATPTGARSAALCPLRRRCSPLIQWAEGRGTGDQAAPGTVPARSTQAGAVPGQDAGHPRSHGQGPLLGIRPPSPARRAQDHRREAESASCGSGSPRRRSRADAPCICTGDNPGNGPRCSTMTATRSSTYGAEYRGVIVVGLLTGRLAALPTTFTIRQAE